jgi:hypothetical protein
MDLGFGLYFLRPVTADEKGSIQIGIAFSLPLGGDYYEENTTLSHTSEWVTMQKKINSKFAIPIIFKYSL